MGRLLCFRLGRGPVGRRTIYRAADPAVGYVGVHGVARCYDAAGP